MISNNAFESAVVQRGRTARAFAFGALAGAQMRQCAAAQLNL